MNYRYIGEDCVFASPGDIFKKSKNGYIHCLDEDTWIGAPAWFIEGSDEFEPVNEELDEYRNNLITWLEDVIKFDEKSAVGKKVLRRVLERVLDETTEGC